MFNIHIFLIAVLFSYIFFFSINCLGFPFRFNAHKSNIILFFYHHYYLSLINLNALHILSKNFSFQYIFCFFHFFLIFFSCSFYWIAKWFPSHFSFSFCWKTTISFPFAVIIHSGKWIAIEIMIYLSLCVYI